MKPQFRNLALAATASSLLAALPVNAANSFYAPGDLVLFFQSTSNSNTIYVNLGNAATNFRGTAPGTAGDYALNKTNIVNISTTLESAFGPGWASDSSIYAGLAGVWRTSDTNTGVQDGDPSRTLYVSKSRDAVGTVGSAESTAWVMGDSAITIGAQGILNQNNAFETNYDSLVTVSPTSISQIDNMNPFTSTALGIQGVAFNAFEGGVQQRGSDSIFGNYDSVGDVEFALDLYRILGRNDLTQVGGEVGTGSFEGTVVIGSNGQVSFLVPEPSSLALSGLAAGALLFRRRRNA